METGNFCCVKETTANAENCTSSFDTRSASKMTQRLFCEEMNVDVHWKSGLVSGVSLTVLKFLEQTYWHDDWQVVPSVRSSPSIYITSSIYSDEHVFDWSFYFPLCVLQVHRAGDLSSCPPCHRLKRLCFVFPLCCLARWWTWTPTKIFISQMTSLPPWSSSSFAKSLENLQLNLSHPHLTTHAAAGAALTFDAPALMQRRLFLSR